MEKKISILECALENMIWSDSRITRTTTNLEKRVWCYNGRHFEAVVVVDNAKPLAVFGKVGWVHEEGHPWPGVHRDETIHNALYVKSVLDHEANRWIPGPVEISECDCCKKEGRKPLMEAEIGKLPKGFVTNEVLQAMGLARRLGDNEVLVKEVEVHSSDASHRSDVHECKAGVEITENDLRDGHLLRPGDSVVLEESVQTNLRGYYTARVLFRNVDGHLVREDGEVEEKRAFAREQSRAIQQEFGLSGKEAWMVISAAGPGAAFQAAAYGRSLLEAGKDPDTLLVVLNQQGPAETYLGWERAARVLRKTGVPPPENWRTSRTFFRVLQGARKFVHLSLKKQREAEEAALRAKEAEEWQEGTEEQS